MGRRRPFQDGVRVSRKQPGGNPAQRDPLVQKLTKTTTAAVELVRDLPGLDAEMQLTLRAASLGLLWVMSARTGLPSPMSVTSTPMKSLQQIKAEAWEEGSAARWEMENTSGAAEKAKYKNPYKEESCS